MIPLDHRDRGNRADPYTEPNSCFSDSSDSLNTLNSMKVPLHLEKTPLNLIAFSQQFDPLNWFITIGNWVTTPCVHSSAESKKSQICLRDEHIFRNPSPSISKLYIFFYDINSFLHEENNLCTCMCSVKLLDPKWADECTQGVWLNGQINSKG